MGIHIVQGGVGSLIEDVRVKGWCAFFNYYLGYLTKLTALVVITRGVYRIVGVSFEVYAIANLIAKGN